MESIEKNWAFHKWTETNSCSEVTESHIISIMGLLEDRKMHVNS